MIMATRGAVPTPLRRRLLLVKDGNVLLTNNHSDTGRLVPIVASILLNERDKHSYIAGANLFETLADLNNQMQHAVPGWRMRISNRRRHALTKDGRKVVTGRFFVDYFSVDYHWKDLRLPRRKFDVINLDLITEHPPEDAESQLEMALALLEMCEHRGIEYKHTRGGLGSAMLKRSPHWKKGRYAAPRFINDTARPYLPGNFYSLSKKLKDRNTLKEGPIPHCYYVDQTSSHHSIVRECALPDPQHVHARGNWKTLDGKWCRPDSEVGRSIMEGRHVGLLLCRMTIGAIPPTRAHLYPQWALQRGTRNVWIWTPELRLLSDHRLQLEHFVASFTATTYDMVLPEYALWATRELDKHKQRRDYKKGSLLAAYGMLAFNGAGRHIYRYWGGYSSKPICEIPRAGLVAESRVTVPDTVQLSTVNVVARGLIESETRTRSIEYGRELSDSGLHIPQVYADGLLVEADTMPFLRNGWRVSHSLTNVWLPRANAIVSDQVVKLPGVSGDDDTRRWEALREDSLRIVHRDGKDARELVTV